MKSLPIRSILFYAFVAGSFLIVDLLIDRIFGEPNAINFPHILLALFAVLVSYILLHRSLQNRRKAEAILLQSRNELENRVKVRTTELERANQTLNTLIQTLPVGLLIVDADYRTILTNPLARSLLGEMPIGQPYQLDQEPNLIRLGGTPIPFEQRPLYRAIKYGEVTTGLEVSIERPDGTRAALLLAASPISDETGQVASAVKVVQDITEIKNMENALQASEGTAQALMNSLSESAVLVDNQGLVLAANETAARRLGVTPTQMLGKSMFEFFSREVSDRRKNYLVETLNFRQPTHYIDERDGRQYDIHIQPVYDENGNIIRLAVFGADITERNRAEQAVRESEERYRTLFDHFSEPVTVWDRNGILLMQNLISARNLGGKREDFIGRSIYEIFGNEAHSYYLRMLRVIESGLTEYQEDVADILFGRRYFWTSMQRIQGPDGQDAVQIISYDITERKRAEEALRSSEEKFSSVFTSAPVAICIIRIATGMIVDVNAAFSRLLGYPRSQVIGVEWREIIPLPEGAWQGDLSEEFRNMGRLMDHEMTLLDREGRPVTVLLSLISITLGGEPSILAFAHDISERKQSEMALHLTQAKLARELQERIALEERQRLARELHDSVSQALYGISLGAHTALTLLDTDRARVLEALNYVVSLVQAGLTEMRALIFELRPESLEREGLVTALNKQMAALSARHEIETNTNLCEEPDVPLSVKEALFRIAQEAMQNAIKHAQANHLSLDLKQEIDSLQLVIADDGLGFDPQADYPGHLGLRSMRERVSELGGALEIVSASPGGTKVLANIPISRT